MCFVLPGRTAPMFSQNAEGKPLIFPEVEASTPRPTSEFPELIVGKSEREGCLNSMRQPHRIGFSQIFVDFRDFSEIFLDY